jgi:hypothetical protein
MLWAASQSRQIVTRAESTRKTPTTGALVPERLACAYQRLADDAQEAAEVELPDGPHWTATSRIGGAS